MTGRWHRPVLWALTAGVGFVLAAPTLIVVPMSFSTSPLLEFPPTGFTTQWYSAYFHNADWTTATKTSLEVALLTVAISLVLGTMLALSLDRARIPGGFALNALVLAPAIVPSIVMALGMFFAYNKLGLLGTMWGLVVGHTVLALPLVVITVGASLRTLDRTHELAAQSLGAGPLRTFLYVTLPLILPGLLAGAVFAFVTSWDELVVAIFLTTPILFTLPVEMWNEIRLQSDPTIAAVSTMLVAVSSFVLLLSISIRRLTAARA